ncbi:cytochrome P450 [Solihabitans fulvus]|uniref:Cytochrome P450 n=1 Tax=Solihabitans fulvus TaxID=1892852 RepID=A0A5B2X675_9PSEU|nr:cytochrome P450 [Solihabitans fulvus]KAA2258695.1 cytochrome P450 [Solihabitans fulvus]
MSVSSANALEQLAENFMRDPYELYARLREDSPATEVLLPRGMKVWLITRYEEARAALADPSLRKDFRAMQELFEKNFQGEDGRPPFEETVLAQHMLNSDQPDHTRLRKLVTKAFTSRRVELLRPRIEEITDELLDNMAGKQQVDLLDTFAFLLPITVICELLGVPVADRDAIRVWSNTLLDSSATPDTINEAAGAMAAYMVGLVEAKRAEPGDDMLSALVHASDDGDSLDQNEVVSMIFLLLVAGHETTVNLIGNGTLALLRSPDQLAALRADRSLLPGAIEEFLRFESPVNTATFRFTAEDTKVGDITIPAGELVLVALGGADRDPHKFIDPDTLDITRPATGHLAFGHGIHYCLGAPLARLEAEIAFDKLLTRFPDLRLAVDPHEIEWRTSSIMRGVRELPVALTPETP